MRLPTPVALNAVVPPSPDESYDGAQIITCEPLLAKTCARSPAKTTSGPAAVKFPPVALMMPAMLASLWALMPVPARMLNVRLLPNVRLWTSVDPFRCVTVKAPVRSIMTLSVSTGARPKSQFDATSQNPPDALIHRITVDVCTSEN